MEYDSSHYEWPQTFLISFSYVSCLFGSLGLVGLGWVGFVYFVYFVYKHHFVHHNHFEDFLLPLSPLGDKMLSFVVHKQKWFLLVLFLYSARSDWN